jgi:hypothetical protein
MPSSSGNGKAGTLRERLAHNQAEMERAIRELEGTDWEEVTENHITVNLVDQTGKHQALVAEKPTRPDNRMPSIPEATVKEVAEGTVLIVSTFDSCKKVVGFGFLLAALAFAAWLRWGR